MPTYNIKAKIVIQTDFQADPDDYENYDGDADDQDAFHDFMSEELQGNDTLCAILDNEGFSVDSVDLKTDVSKGSTKKSDDGEEE